MALTPVTDALELFGPAEVIPIGWFGQPAALAVSMAASPTLWLGTVVLPVSTSWIRQIQLAAMLAFLVSLLLHAGNNASRSAAAEAILADDSGS